MVEALAREKITAPAVLTAMAHVPREHFISKALRSEAFVDAALPIGEQQTISQPLMVAIMTQAFELTGHERVLEIGTGAGYQAAILAECASPVIFIERFPKRADEARARLQNLGYN